MPDWLRALLWVCLVVLLPLPAQAATYAYRNDTFSYDTPSGSAATVGWHGSGGAPACTGYPNGDDDWADVSFPGGFAFTFGGVKYTGVRIYSNGILAFGNDVSGFHRDYQPEALPASSDMTQSGCPTAAPLRVMLAYWIDIVAGTANSTSGASVKYELLGTAPNRRFVISWVNVKLYNTSTRYNFQVALYESADGVNGNFRYQYTSGSSTGVDATVGVQLDASDFTQYSYDQAFIDTVNGTAILWYPANQLATKTAEYRFDEGVWAGTADEIRDTSGNALHAALLGNASNVAGGRLCRGGSFPNNTTATTRDAVATPVAPGNSGSIDFWFNSNTAWNSADAMLFDAGTLANRPFFLMKRSTGALRFAVADSAGTTLTANTGSYTFAASSWQHVGVTWNIRAGSNLSLIQIFVNGALVASQRGTLNGVLGTSGAIVIGDNATAGVTPSGGTARSANGRIDEFYVYPIDVSGPQFQADMALTRPVCTALDHFRIEHDGSVACGATARITITAHDQNHAPFSLAGTTMTVSTSTGHGTWSTVTAINPIGNLGGGAANYTFANESSVVLGLSNPYTETLNINVNSGGITEKSGAAAACVAADHTHGGVCDADLTFLSCVSGFECLATGVAHTNLATASGGRNPLYTRLAGTAFGFDVVALDPAGNRLTTYAAAADSAVTVELVDGSGSTACASRTALTPAASQTLTFTQAAQPTEQGRKGVSFTVARAYPELRCRVTDSNVTPAVQSCSSDSFALRPASLTIASTANADPAGGNTTATPRVKAGSSFTLSAASGVAGYTGTPKVDAGKLEAHAGAVQTGTLSGTFGAAAAATGTASGSAFAYSEVGYFRFAAQGIYDDAFTAVDSAAGDCTDDFSNSAVSGRYGCKFGNTAASDHVGRFVPDHFDTEVTHACGSFTYSGQPFPFRAFARNGSGATTQNYAGSFARAATYSNAGGAAGSFSPASLPASAFSGGVADLTTPPQLRFTFPAKLTVPSVLQVRIADPDTVSSAGGSEQTTPIRSGRLRLGNVYGYAAPLRMPVQAQYWGGVSWIPNDSDSCTVLAAGNLKLTPAGWTVGAPGALAGGNGFITLTPTGAGNVGVCADLGPDNGVSCSATGANAAWLQSRWPGGAGHDNDPSATATFGVYSPEGRRGIYNRELY